MIGDPSTFEKLAEQRSEKLAVLYLAAGAYDFETCAECEPKVYELVKGLHWRVSISSVYPIELDERAKQLEERERTLFEELSTHRSTAGHGLKKSPDERLLEELQRVVLEYDTSQSL